MTDFPLNITVEPDEDMFIAKCPELNLYSTDTSIEKALVGLNYCGGCGLLNEECRCPAWREKETNA